MEDLGDLSGLDYETAYFMKYGRNAPYKKKEYNFTPPKFDWETANKQDEFYCWYGSRIPQWFE